MMQVPTGPKPDKSYKNNDFLNSPEARMIRIMCELQQPVLPNADCPGHYRLSLRDHGSTASHAWTCTGFAKRGLLQVCMLNRRHPVNQLVNKVVKHHVASLIGRMILPLEFCNSLCDQSMQNCHDDATHSWNLLVLVNDQH